MADNEDTIEMRVEALCRVRSNQEKKRVWSICISQFCFGIAVVLFYFSELHKHVDRVNKNLELWVLGVFIAQCFLAVLCGWFGPFHTEVIEWKYGGFILKSLFEAGVTNTALYFLFYVVEERPNTAEYLTRHGLSAAHETHNLLDVPIFAMVVALAIYSLFLSFVLQPGLDFTISGTFLELMLHMSVEAKMNGAVNEWSTYITVSFTLMLTLSKNLNEHRARRRIRAQAEAAPAPLANPIQIHP